MSATRDSILAALRQSPGTAGPPATHSAAGQAPRPPIGDDPLARLERQFAQQGVRFAHLGEVEALPRYLQQHCGQRAQGPLPVSTGSAALFERIPWHESGCERRAWQHAREGGVALSVAVCAVAESGSLVLASGPDNPTSLNFLPERQVVLFGRDTIVNHFEDMWRLLRQRFPRGLPRALNLLSGPSSSLDVGMTLAVGVHGPLELHALMLENI